ncbi:MAG: hypothetical protein WCG50_00725 [Rhodoferax sp.]|uniref:cytochrome b n=1 Tax=Rhodoferax sp. TaxID=50421 RepID=UPI003015E366
MTQSTRAYPPVIEQMSLPAILAHWISALAIGFTLSATWLRDYIDPVFFEEFDLRVSMFGHHHHLVLVVVLLWSVRLIACRLHPPKNTDESATPNLKLVALVCHSAFFTILLAMPLLDWIVNNAQGHIVWMFHFLPMPQLVAPNPDLAYTLQQWQEWGAMLLLSFVALDFLIDMWHHVMRRDHVHAARMPFAKNM